MKRRLRERDKCAAQVHAHQRAYVARLVSFHTCSAGYWCPQSYDAKKRLSDPGLGACSSWNESTWNPTRSNKANQPEIGMLNTVPRSFPSSQSIRYISK